MKMKSFPVSFPLLMVICYGALLLIYPEESSAGAHAGLIICFELIIPSLFPFFVLSSLLVSLGFATLIGKCLKRWMWPLFRLSGSCAAAFILGAIGGYPVGARTTAQLYENHQCTKKDALHLSAFCNNCGPAFLFSVTGVGVFSSKAAGFLLLGTHLAASCLIGFLFRFFPFAKEDREDTLTESFHQTPPFSSVFSDCIRDSFSSTLNVCAFVVLFSVLLRLATCSGLLSWAAEHLSELLPAVFSPALCHSLIAGIFEVSTGIYTLSDICTSKAALPLAAFILGWGGFSVHCQSLPFLTRCVDSLFPYFLGKFMQGLFAAILTAILTVFIFPIDVQVNIPVQTFFWGNSTIQLLQQEILAIWFLSGAYSLLHWKKGLVNDLNLHYNKNK
jgi:sporulation integral membrane protein YlbJ